MSTAGGRERKLITIITPCYNEEENIDICRDAIRDLFSQELARYDYEHIFADNASADGSVAILKRLAREDSNVRVILNARNFGPFRSTFNALTAARGDAVVVLLAADLQDPPEVISTFVEKWEAGYEIVYGVRANREEGFLMRVTRRIYYRLVSTLAEISIPQNAGEFQLIDRKIVDVLKACDDYYPYLRGMIANSGFRSVGVPYTWKARERGFSKNRIFNLIDQALNGIISFTHVPLRLAIFLGTALALSSIGYAIAQLLINVIFYRDLAPPGVATMIVALFFFSGVQLFFLGMLGEYVGAIHFQVRKRPLVIERERINFDASSDVARTAIAQPRCDATVTDGSLLRRRALLAADIRRLALQMVHHANASHIGSCLSIADILAHLYGGFLRVDPKQPGCPLRDRFILSKGHAAAGIYAALAKSGFFPTEELERYCDDGGRFSGHVSQQVPGVEVSTGSLGHGLSIGVGMALGLKRENSRSRVVVLLSDGECDEGATWEAALVAPHHGLDNVLAIVDYNKIQSLGRVEDVAPLEPFQEKWCAFNWAVREIDGHDHRELTSVLTEVPFERGKPSVVLAHTVKGKGVSFMQDRVVWHYKSPDISQLEAALLEIDESVAAVAPAGAEV